MERYIRGNRVEMIKPEKINSMAMVSGDEEERPCDDKNYLMT